MIHVLASIHVKEGKRAQALAAIHGNLAAVRAEAGCIQYTPAVDIDADMPAPVSYTHLTLPTILLV